MAKTNSDVYKFEEELKAKVSIAELFTHLTKEEFVTVNGAKRAKAVWREDNTPSVHFHPGKNLLTDFAAPNKYPGKKGEIINHFDLLIKTRVVANKREAVKWLAEYTHCEIPKSLKPIIEKAGREQDALKALWKACQEFAIAVCSSPQTYESISSFCTERHIPLERDFFTTMEIGVWPMSRVINQIIEEYKLNSKDSKLVITTPINFESRAIVFPLYNKHGAITGLTVRSVEEKKFLKFAIDDSGAYGLVSALAEERAIGVEGQLNRVAMAAALYRLYGAQNWREYMPPMFAIGSNSFNTAQLKDIWNDFLYIPDFDIKLLEGDKSKKEVIDTLILIYNAMQVPSFSIVSWKEGYDKYDLEDFLRERIGQEEAAFAELKTLNTTMPEFTRDFIERKVKNTPDKQKDSARYAYCQSYGTSFYNIADSKALLKLYEFINTESLDPDVVDNTMAGIPQSFGNNVIAFGFAYYHVEFNGEEEERTKISNFVFQPLYKIIQKPEAKGTIGEFEGQIAETHSLHANLRFENGLKFPVTFEYKDLIDVKGFLSALAKANIDARTSVIGGKQSESEVFQCALITLNATPLEVLRLQAAGPHLRMDTPEHRRNTLRPNWFGVDKAIKTYLCKGYSVIDGNIVTNRSVNLEFQTSDCYNFGIYSDEEHIQTSHFIWKTLRKVHREWFVDSMLGLVCATPIKHLINPALNGQVVVLLGQTEAHKTSTSLIMSNFFGDVPSDSYLVNFHGTAKSFELKVAQAGSVFLVCDEFKARPDFTVQMLGDIIHSMFGSHTRSRLTQNAKQQEVFSYTGTYVMTGEQLSQLESSTEARFLLYRLERFDASEEYEKVMEPQNLQKFKCWTPRMICWEHNNIKELQSFYQDRRLAQKIKLGSVQNAVRVADQQAFVETGYYALCRYLEDLDIITTEERETSIQKYLIWSEKNISEQISRAEQTTNTKKFLQYLKEMIDSGALNYVTFSGEGQSRQVRFSQDQRRPYQIVIFEKKGELKYAITSFDSLIRDICRHYGRVDLLQTSVKFDLQEQDIIKLEAKGGFTVVEIPDPQNPTKNKRIRAAVLTHKDLYGDVDDSNSRCSGLSGDSEN